MMKQLFNHVMRASIVLIAIFVLSCKDDPEPIPEVTSSFTQTVDNNTGVVTFKNTSTNATSYLWDLNDGTTSTLFEPTNTYETGTYTVKLTASNSAGGTATSQNTFTVTLPVTVDTTKPIITLTGEATINLTVGDPYVDKGATANDNLDGNITANIVKTGSVDTATPGTYVITYNVSDAAANAAIPVTRSVIVTAFDDGLLENGAFSIVNGQPGAAWSGNAFNVINEGGTNFNFANVTAAGDAFNVNLSQVLPLVQGKNYVLSFEASSDRARTMIAGIGLSVDPFTNDTKTVNLTTTKQTITLELSALTFGGANSRVLFDMGAAVGVVVIDNVKLIEGAPTPCTAETVQSLAGADFNLTFKTDPGTAIINDNAGYSYAANPNIANTVNPSCFVGKTTKNAGNPYGNNQIIVDAKFNFNTNSGFKMKVYSAVAGSKVLLKLEDKAAPGINKEVLKTVTQANVWEELTFDFAGSESNKYDRIVLFADFEGNAASTVYFDDLRLYGTGTPAPTPISVLPATFETGEQFSAVFEAANVNGSITANTVSGGINTSANVYRFNKPAGGEFYGGMENVFATPLNMTTNRTFKVKVYSTKPNAVFRFELQTRPGGPNYTIDQTVTNANEWVELTFDFGAPTVLPPSFNPNIYNAIVIIPDFNTANNPTSTSETYYIDDLSLVNSGGGGGGGSTSVYCNTEVKHLGIPAETASAIDLTIKNIGSQSMKVSITSADADAVDLLIVNNSTGPITGSPSVSAVDSSIAGTLSITLTWTGTPPSEVVLNILWSKASFGGNWQLGTADTTVSFSQTCP